MTSLTAPSSLTCRVTVRTTWFERSLRRLAVAIDAYALRRVLRRAERRSLEQARADADEQRALLAAWFSVGPLR